MDYFHDTERDRELDKLEDILCLIGKGMNEEQEKRITNYILENFGSDDFDVIANIALPYSSNLYTEFRMRSAESR